MFYLNQKVIIIKNTLNDDDDDGCVGKVGVISKYDNCDYMDNLNYQLALEDGTKIWCSDEEIEHF